MYTRPTVGVRIFLLICTIDGKSHCHWNTHAIPRAKSLQHSLQLPRFNDVNRWYYCRDNTGMVESIPHSWIKKWNVYWRNPVWVGSYKTLQHNHLHYGHFNLLMFLVLYLFPIILLNNRSINYHKVSTSERMQYSSTLIQNEGGFTRSDPTMNAGHFKGGCDDLAIHATQL